MIGIRHSAQRSYQTRVQAAEPFRFSGSNVHFFVDQIVKGRSLVARSLAQSFRQRLPKGHENLLRNLNRSSPSPSRRLSLSVLTRAVTQYMEPVESWLAVLSSHA